MHLPPLIQDLAIIMGLAGISSLLFRYLKQPIVLGYVLVGFLVGPSTRWFPTVLEPESLKVWAEIGVIILLFTLGLEFSVRKLLKVGSSALITASIEVLGMVGLGFFLAQAMGLRTIDSLYLGGICAISSTSLILKSFEEFRLKTRGFVKLVFGILVIEDVVAVLLMVFLSTAAQSKGFSSAELLESVMKLVFFVLIWFGFGVLVVPSVFRRMRALLTDEVLLITSAGLCLTMVALATEARFSPALGAFVMGSVLAETKEAQRIVQVIFPIRNFFAAIFFVSVGMMIDPVLIWEHIGMVLAVSLMVVVGKFSLTFLGSIVSGQGFRHSVQSALSLTQIGEFSFIIAGLGSSLGVTSSFLYPVAIGVSVLTMFVTPLLLRNLDPLVGGFQRRFPVKLLTAIERGQRKEQQGELGEFWKHRLRTLLIRICLNGAGVFAAFTWVNRFFLSRLEPWGVPNDWAQWISVLVAFSLASPFLWGIGFSSLDRRKDSFEAVRTARDEFLSKALLLVRLLLVSLVSLIGIVRYFPTVSGVVVGGVLIPVFILVFFRRIESIHARIEENFLRNFSSSHEDELVGAPHRLAPWDAHLAKIALSTESPFVGHTLESLKIRENFGVTVAAIERGRKFLAAPGRGHVLFPGDILQVIGTDAQLETFSIALGPSASEDTHAESKVALRSIVVLEGAWYAHKTIRDCGIRERTNGLVVGIESNGVRVLNPDSTTIILPGSVLWLVGDEDKVKALG